MSQDQNPIKVRRHRMTYTIWIVAFFIAVSVAIYIRSPLADIKDITVQGAINLSVADIIQDSGMSVGESLLSVSNAKTTNRLLSDYPILKSVVVNRNFITQTVTIHVKEKTIAGILAAGGSLYRVLTDGTVLDRDPTGLGVSAPIITTFFPVIVSLGERLTDPSLLQIFAQLPYLPAADANQLSELHVEDYQGTQDILAFTRDGFEIRMPTTNMVRSMQLYDVIHQKIQQAHVAPGLINVMNGDEAVYQPYLASNSNLKKG